MLRALAIRCFAGLLLALASFFPPMPAGAQPWQQAALMVPDVSPVATRVDRSADRSIVHYNRVRPHGPLGEVGRADPDLRALLLRALSRHRLGEADRALADYDEILRRQPDHAVARLNRGIVLSTHKAEPGKAIADFDHVLALMPDSADALVFRGDAHLRLGDYRQALDDLDRAVMQTPDHAQTHVLRGLARALLGQAMQAAADYDRALSIDRRNVEALVNRAAIRAGAGDPAGAIRDLDDALVIEPGNALAHYNRGYARFARGEHDQAVADYSAAIRLDPRLGWAYLNRCLTRVVAGRETALAAADCDRAQRLLPDHRRVRETLAFVRRDVAAARAFTGRALN